MKLIFTPRSGFTSLLKNSKFILTLFFIGLMSAGTVKAQSVTLSTTIDENNGNTASIAALIGTPGGAGISLREAILAANNEPNGSVVTITMPAGTYTTTIGGGPENLGVSGDIDVNVSASAGMKTVTINGAGAGVTIITGSTGERVFDVHAVSNPGSITFNLSGVTISGTTIASGSGAALLLGRAGDISNISNCVFSGNSAPNSGAITQSSSLVAHDLTVTNCTFTNNTATTGGPGALNYNGIGNVTITGCTFTGNTAATQGGAINITGGGTGPVTTNILNNTFLNNTANGTQFGGAAVSITNAQTVNINFNRLFNNTSPNLNTALTPNFGDGRVITASGGVIGSLNVDNNWWGVNTGPVTTATSRSVFGATPTRWLNLRNTASPSPICVGATSTITASFLANNLSEVIAPANLTTLVGQPITFNAPVNGTLSAAQTTIQAAGTATVTFTATTAGGGSANAVFVPATENFTVTTSPTITVNAANTAGAPSSNPTVCVNTAISPNITIATTGATGIGAATGLPAGVSASWAANVITISGTPTTTVGSPFNYSIPLTGGCGTVNATGTITVSPLNTVTLSSAAGTDAQTVAITTPITNITYNTTGATSATVTGLPPGVTGSWAANVVTISGSPTSAAGSPYTYTVTLTGGCGTVTATGTITVTTCSATDQTVTASPTTICTGASSTITVGASQPGVNYTLRLDPSNTYVAGPTASNGPAINFGTGALATTTTYNVLAETDKYSINLNGGQAGFSIPANAALDLSNNFTLEGWIKPAGNALFARMFNKDQSYALGISNNQNSITFTRHNAGDFSVPFTFTNGTWYHIACTYVSGTVEFFVNGVSQGTVGGVPAIVLQPGTGGQIGSDAGGGFNRFNGNIDNVRIWNSVRTQPQISANQTAFLTSTGNPNLVASWWIIEGAGNAKDYSANAINATALAGTWQVDAPVAPCSIVLTTKPTVTVNGNNTITLSSAPGTDAQTVCINTAITNITYNTTVATGATFSGLPAGVTGAWAANVITISGTPTTTVGSPFTYTVTLTGGCGTVSTTGTITVNPANTIALTSAPGTNAQTLCINTPITNITYSTTGATGATFSGLPAGVTGAWAVNVVTISGTPTASGTFNYTVTQTGGCPVTANGTITVTANNTITLTSAPGTNAQTACINTPITNITYNTTGATGATFSGLPAGVTGTWLANVVTISGSPTTIVGSPFSYTVTLNGGCGTITATGTITVNPNNTMSLTSAPATTNQTVLVNTPITNVTYSTTGATGATFSGLPTGVTGSWAANTVTISGSPSVLGTFNYTITLTGGCGAITANGTINVVACSITRTSAAGTDAQTVCNNTAITNITYATTGATGASFTGLPAGVTGNWAANVATISGTPTVAGTFGYVVTLTGGGCGAFNATGTITVNPTPDVTQPANQVVCNNTPTTAVNFTGSVPGTVFNWVNNTPSIGLAASGTGNIASFTAINTGTAPVVATVTVTPSTGASGSATFNYTASIVNWTVPAGVTSVTITSNGARGGNSGYNGFFAGGSGASIQGTFTTTPGEQLNILVGGQGADNTSNIGLNSGGGGGSFVWRPAGNTLLIAAGGGSGSGSCRSSAGQPGLATLGGGGTGGVEGIACNTNGAGGGGAGWLQNGFGASSNVFGSGGLSPLNGGAGGAGSTFTQGGYLNSAGGFGGGGGAGGNCGGGGGGGGFNGGKGGDNTLCGAGYSTALGGTSYNIGNAQTNISGANAGNGQITISYTGTTCTGTPRTFTYTVNPTPTAVATPASQTVCSATPITTIVITGNAVAGVVYNWTRDNTGTVTGIAASGSGNISGTLTNTTNVPITVTFTITPTANGCPGTPVTATVLVNPTPTVNAVSNQSLCNGASTTAVNFTGVVTAPPGTVYNWTNTQPSIGLAASGSGNIASFTATNAGAVPVVATIQVTPSYTNGGTTCNGTPTIFTITVNPTPAVTITANPATGPYCGTGPVLTANSPQCSSGVTYSASFTNGVYTPANCTSWNTFRSQLTGSYNSLTLTSSLGGTHTLSDPATAQNIANAMLTGTPGTWVFGGNTYNVGVGCGPGSAVELYINQPACQCNSSISIRPCIANSNWGGVNAATCFAPSQVLTVTFGTLGGGCTYLWNTGATTQSITPTVSGTYTVTVTTASGCVNTATYNVTITPVPDVNQPANQVVCNNTATAAINFTGSVPGTVYNWTNNTPSIGLAASGAGNIASFTATNATASPVVATITVTPSFTNGGGTCTGTPRTFTITVNPTPTAIATPASQTICSGSAITTIVNSGTVPGTVYNWVRDNPAVTGIANSGTGNISGSLTNPTNIPITVTFTVTPSYTNAGVTCTGTPVTATVVVNPTPTVNAVANQVVCNGAPTTAVVFTGAVTNPPGTVYNWTNNTTSIGLAASGTGNIASFTATNATTAPVTATIVVTPSYTNGGVTCTGASTSFTITVNPTATVIVPANAFVCNGTLQPTGTYNFSTTATGGVTTYTWTNNDISIGLGASGAGNSLPTFTATNPTTVPITGTITVTPTFTNGGVSCVGTPNSFSITVNPTPNATATPTSQTICSAGTITTIVSTGTVPGTVFNWTRDNNATATGIAASGSGNISGSLTNTTNGPVLVTFTITPSYTNGGTTCTGTPVTATVLVNPLATVNPVSNQMVCNGDMTTAVNFTSSTTGGTIVYNWTNNLTSIGLAASGTGNIAAFTAINTGTAPVTATITVTPSYTNGGITCVGASTIFTITVNPSGQVNQPANQVVCNNAPTAPVIFTTTTPGTIFNWTNNTTSIGLAASGTGNIASFIGTNATNAPVVATVTVTPVYTGGGGPVTGPAFYIRDNNPWGQTSNDAAMTAVFGAPNWTAVNYAVNPATVFVPGTKFVFIEGSDGNAIAMNAFVTANITAIQNWVSAGGRLFMNAAPNQGGNMNWGFGGVTCVYPSFSGSVTATVPGHPIYVGPFTPVTTAYTGTSFSHASLTGGGLTNLMNGNAPGQVLGTLNWGSGSVMFGTMTTVNWHSPAPQAQNLRQNIIAFAAASTISCPGPSKTFTITVNPTPTVNPVANQIVCAGSPTAAVIFTGFVPGTVYNWTNNNPNIGLVNSGSGNIASFIAVNVGTAPDVAIITVTPTYTNGGVTCTGTPITFTITVNPQGQVNQPADQAVCNGAPTAPVNFTTTVPGTTFAWTNNNTSIGLAAGGTGNIASFIGTNATNAPNVGTITVTPTYVPVSSATATFNFTGGMQTFTVPAGVTSVNIQALGAQGGSGAVGGAAVAGGTGGLGASATGTLAVVPGQVLNIFVGGQGATPTGGFNGGGNGGNQNSGGGGGASDVRAGGSGVANRVITAGGGGGGGRGGCDEGSASTGGIGGNGGSGGGGVGANGASSPTSGGVAGGGFGGNAGSVQGAFGAAGIGCGGFLGAPGSATATETGANGGNGQTCCCFSFGSIPGGGGGGGGQIGGGGAGGGSAGTTGCSGNSKGAGGGGGGGSSFIGGVTAGATANGVQSGNGQVVITYLLPAGPSCPGTPKTFTITVNPTPVVNPVASQVVCNNAPTANINFTSPTTGGTITYNWTNSLPSIGLPASGTGDILSFIATNATNAPVTANLTVTMTYVNAGATCTSATVSFTITVNPTPQVDQPASQSLCANTATAPVVFTSPTTGGTLVFNWTNNQPAIGLAASGTGNIASFIALNATALPIVATITVTPVYTNAGTTCTGPFKTFTITVNPIPVVAPQNNRVFCNGVTTPIITFGGTAGSTYSWTNSNTGIGLAASGTGDILPFVTTNATNGPIVATITVTPSAGGCTGTPITFTITVNPTPIVNPVPSQVVCNGTPTTVINFTSPTTGPTGALTFTWTNSAPSIGLAANGTGNIPSFIAVNTGLSPVIALITVTPVYTNAGITCTGNSQTFTITVNPTPTVNPVANQVLCVGSSTAPVNFTGSVFGTIYNWTNNNTSIGLAAAGAGNIASFVATNVTNVAQVATITVTPNYTNGVTCPGTPITFTITVNPIPTVNPVANQTVCAGTTVTQVFSGPVAGTVYNWTNSNTAIGLGASGSGNISFTSTNTTGAPLTGTITVTPTYTNGGGSCTGSPVTFTITVNPIPTVNVVLPQVLCNGSNTAAVNFTGAVAGTVYNWTNSNTTIGLAAAGTGNIASFVATNATAVVQIATITVTPSYTNGGTTCTGTPITFTITVNPTPSVNTVANQTVCNGTATTAVTIAGPVAGTVYSWNNNNTSIGLGASGTNTIPSFTAINTGSTPVTATITITPIFTNGGISCTGPSSTFTITVNPTAVVNQPADQLLCNGASTAAVVFSGLPPGSTYNWTNSNTAIGLGASGTGNIPSFIATNTTTAPITATITVTPTSTGCGGTSVSFTITVNPTPSVNAIANQTVCAGSSTAAVTISGPVANTIYTWTNNNTSIGLGASGTGNIPAFVAVNPTIAPVTATITVTPNYTNGGITCTGASVSFTITVNPLPNIVFPRMPTRVCITDTIVTLVATPAGGTWSGTGIVGNTFNPAIAGLGVTRVTYTVTNAFGCTTSRFENVVVHDCIERHNVFQQAIRIWPNPNNGRFSVQFNSDKYKEFKVKIVNARGQEMAYYEFKNLVYGQILPFDLTRLAAGQYFLYVYNSQESGVFPIVIAR